MDNGVPKGLVPQFKVKYKYKSVVYIVNRDIHLYPMQSGFYSESKACYIPFREYNFHVYVHNFYYNNIIAINLQNETAKDWGY